MNWVTQQENNCGHLLQDLQESTSRDGDLCIRRVFTGLAPAGEKKEAEMGRGRGCGLVTKPQLISWGSLKLRGLRVVVRGHAFFKISSV